jgi:hypothetical protein
MRLPIPASNNAYRVSFGPILMGFLTGVVVTTVFGFLPVLSATRVRPATVLLRRRKPLLSRAGWGQMLLCHQRGCAGHGDGCERHRWQSPESADHCQRDIPPRRV